MKKKKSMIMLALFVAVLVLGVGYAAISNVTLTVSGTAATETRALKVAFNGTVVPDANSTGANVSGTAANNSLSGTISVTGLSEVDDEVYVTYTIKNDESDYDAIVYLDTVDNSETDFFRVTTDVDDVNDAVTVPANGTATVTVTVKVLEIPVSADHDEADITVTFTAEPVDPYNP